MSSSSGPELNREVQKTFKARDSLGAWIHIFPEKRRIRMVSEKYVPILFTVLLVLSSFIGTVAAADYFSNGGFFSTGTTVSGTGTLNETVSIQYITHDGGMTKTTEWVSAQTLKDPSALSWNSQLSLGTKEDSLWWDFQRTGLPVTWEKTETFLPVIATDVQTPTFLPVTWKGTLTPPFLPVTWKKLSFF
jgi:hypothetical protein